MQIFGSDHFEQEMHQTSLCYVKETSKACLVPETRQFLVWDK